MKNTPIVISQPNLQGSPFDVLGSIAGNDEMLIVRYVIFVFRDLASVTSPNLCNHLTLLLCFNIIRELSMLYELCKGKKANMFKERLISLWYIVESITKMAKISRGHWFHVLDFFLLCKDCISLIV